MDCEVNFEIDCCNLSLARRQRSTEVEITAAGVDMGSVLVGSPSLHWSFGMPIDSSIVPGSGTLGAETRLIQNHEQFGKVTHRLVEAIAQVEGDGRSGFPEGRLTVRFATDRPDISYYWLSLDSVVAIMHSILADGVEIVGRRCEVDMPRSCLVQFWYVAEGEEEFRSKATALLEALCAAILL